jgi:hypothetical protein
MEISSDTKSGEMPLCALFGGVAVGLLMLASAPIVPAPFRLPRALLAFCGCLTASPILILFFRAYHALVPTVVLREELHSSQATDGEQP